MLSLLSTSPVFVGLPILSEDRSIDRALTVGMWTGKRKELSSNMTPEAYGHVQLLDEPSPKGYLGASLHVWSCRICNLHKFSLALSTPQLLREIKHRCDLCCEVMGSARSAWVFPTSRSCVVARKAKANKKKRAQPFFPATLLLALLLFASSSLAAWPGPAPQPRAVRGEAC